MTVEQAGLELQRLLGADCVITDADSLAQWASDWRGMYTCLPLAVVRARTTAQVAECVRYCAASGIPVIPRGGNTGLCGGATPVDGKSGVVISLDRMNSIRSVDVLANTMVAEAGCILGELQRAAESQGRLFPLSLAAEDSCQLGGNLATNAGGVNVLRYGMARELVLGLEVVLPSGEIWNGLRTLRKDNTGYDLKQLFLGSEGTLGIITAAAVKIYPATPARAVALAAVGSAADALKLFSLFYDSCGQRVDAFEYFTGACLDLVLSSSSSLRSPFPDQHPGYVLIELADTGDEAALAEMMENTLGTALERGACSDVVIANSYAQQRNLWQLREDISEAQRLDGPHLKQDVSLPIACIPEFLENMERLLHDSYPGLRLFVFGHFGDGNLHYNVSRPLGAPNEYFKNGCGVAITDLILNEVASRGGSFSAEHGIGQLKRTYLEQYKSDLEVRMMRDVKKIFDPKGIMNPGKVI